MNACPTCGGPLAWSDTHRTTWCAVYGQHRPIVTHLAKTHAPAWAVNEPGYCWPRDTDAPAAKLIDAIDAPRYLKAVS